MPTQAVVFWFSFVLLPKAPDGPSAARPAVWLLGAVPWPG